MRWKKCAKGVVGLNIVVAMKKTPVDATGVWITDIMIFFYLWCFVCLEVTQETIGVIGLIGTIYIDKIMVTQFLMS